MQTVPVKKKLCHRKPKVEHFESHEEYLKRIAKSLYCAQLPLSNCTSLPVTELAAEIFSQSNKFSLNRLDIEKAAYYMRSGYISPCLLVLALLYLERLKSSNPRYLTKVSPTELFLTSLLVGSKFLQDDGEEDELNNTEWAALTGLTVQEVNKAEKEFLDAINWEVFVSHEEFWNKFNMLEFKVGLRQGSKRGWFTYSELNLLLQLIDLSHVLQCFWNVTSACILSYTASVLTLVGSALLVNQIPFLQIKPKVPVTGVGEWTTTSDLTVAGNLYLHSDLIQDCNTSTSLELTSEPNITEPEFSKLYLENAYLNAKFKTSHAITLNFLRNLYLHLSSKSFLDFEQLPSDTSKKDTGLTVNQGFNIWIWSDYIRNYLLKKSIPKSVYSIASY